MMNEMNNKIKLIKRQAYGFSNFEHLEYETLDCIP
jgi:transposase